MTITIFCYCRIQFLRHLKDFFGVMYKMDASSRDVEDEELRLGTEKILMTCVGVGFSNLSKTMT